MPSESSKGDYGLFTDDTSLIIQLENGYYYPEEFTITEEKGGGTSPVFCGWETKIAPLELIEWKE